MHRVLTATYVRREWKAGTGDVVFCGMSFYARSTFSVSGAALSMIGSYSDSAMMVADGSCYPSNKTFPNGGLPACMQPDIMPAKKTVNDSLLLMSQAHDYIRALGECVISLSQ